VKPFLQAGLLVPDLDAAMKELSAMLGVRWGAPVEAEQGEWKVRVVFCQEGPPWIELIEGSPGSPWDGSAGPQLDHIGFWSADLLADSERIEANGGTLEVDGREMAGFRYLRAPASGLRIELLNDATRGGFFSIFGMADPEAA
jgi:hypothetical protein